MHTKIFKNQERGHFDFGWLKTYHSFSFGNYFDYNRVKFGALRVLNDDTIEKGAGFGTHGHENMEIITIPLQGVVAHKDSTGGNGEIKVGEVQVMSAGTGILHSEYNSSNTKDLKLLQIWIITQSLGITPRYDQKKFDEDGQNNKFQTVVAGDLNKFESKDKPLWINQNVYLSLAKINSSEKIDYTIYDINNGVFFFLIEGEVKIADQTLQKRDSLEVSNLETQKLTIEALKNAYILAIEVPMV